MKKTGSNLFSVLCALVGIVLIVLSLTDVLPGTVWLGFGIGLTVVSFFQLGRMVAEKKDDEYREKRETEEKDERNRFLVMKAWSWTGIAYIFVAGAVVIITKITGNDQLCSFASFSVCAILVIYCVCHLIAGKKY